MLTECFRRSSRSTSSSRYDMKIHINSITQIFRKRQKVVIPRSCINSRPDQESCHRINNEVELLVNEATEWTEVSG
ncbi:unnamed protein product [Cuscuta campestris]|uniref:Uncharacterized protein n=1 Tax=Cuscuta campestris TaxID=132261 RepID=A0A484NSZ7_9ASTE|nr:unnamed protein product [Cuscuta campestris]